MATEAYFVGRKVYQRPQALCFADNPGTLVNDKYVPDGSEFSNFIILSDHNRGQLSMGIDRIETRKRTINGRMRSYWIADKLTISTQWQDLPSRGWATGNPIDGATGKVNFEALPKGYRDQFTADGGAGGNELLEWYRGHKGSFWVYLAYDRYPSVGAYDKLGEYNEVIEMFLAEFSYDVVKRGGTNMDLWNVDLKLEEA
jgi:hypothetical protein